MSDIIKEAENILRGKYKTQNFECRDCIFCSIPIHGNSKYDKCKNKTVVRDTSPTMFCDLWDYVYIDIIKALGVFPNSKGDCRYYRPRLWVRFKDWIRKKFKRA